MRKRYIKIYLAVVALTLASLACSVSGGPRTGSQAPDFQLTSTSGKEFSLSAFRGRPVLLNFFTTWCGPCRDEMPGMQSVYSRYRQEGLILLAVDLGDKPGDVASYRKELGLGFPLLLDQESQVGNLYGVSSFPRTFFIDSEGVIRKVSIGSMPEGDIQAEVENLLKLARETKAKQVQAGSSEDGVVGCVNIGTVLARTGPGKSHPAEMKLKHSDCYPFDARSADGTWLRMANALSSQGERLWVTTEFIDLKVDVNTLPVAK